MECVRNCRLCPRFILSQAVTFADDTLTINLPANAYGNCQKYCIVVAQSIPAETTINAPVVFTIGDDTTEYPFVNGDCTPIYASQIRTRRIYPTRVNTAVNSGVFKYIGNCPLPSNATTTVQSIPVTPATPATTQSSDTTTSNMNSRSK